MVLLMLLNVCVYMLIMQIVSLYRELRSLTKDCHAAKLFSKHMKIEEQVLSLTIFVQCYVNCRLSVLCLRFFNLDKFRLLTMF